MADPYVYPGTSVLRNKENIRNAEDLEAFERRMTLQRMSEGLHSVQISAGGFRELHRHLFQDVYDWAGQDRIVELAKGSSYFCRAEFIGIELDKRFAALKTEHGLRGLSRDQFAERAADHLNELNAIHPFREGNGRAMRALLKEIAGQAGHDLSLQAIKPDEWNHASITGFHKGDYQPMAKVVAEAISGPKLDLSPEQILAKVGAMRDRRLAREGATTQLSPEQIVAKVDAMRKQRLDSPPSKAERPALKKPAGLTLKPPRRSD